MSAPSRLRPAGLIAAAALVLSGGAVTVPARAEGGPGVSAEGAQPTDEDAEAAAAAAKAKAARLRAARIKAARLKAAKAAADKAAADKAAAEAQAKADALKAVAAAMPPPPPPEPPRPTFATIRCANTLMVSTPRGYHTSGEGDLYLDLLAQGDGRVEFRVHPGVFPSVALALRDCVLGTCAGTMTRDSYSLADHRMAGEARITVDLGRVNAQFVATSETLDPQGKVLQVLTERGTCEPAPSATRF
jgi:hypothetical protein